MTKVELQYYTDRVDTALAQTVRGIKGQHTQFATDYLGDAAQDDDSRTCVQLRAWRRPGEEGWQIDRYTMLGAAAGHAVKKQQETKTDLCFFDALEYCASFQVMQKEIGKIAFPAPDNGEYSVVSYREAAKAAGQVIDADGKACPCAFGQIMGEGFFTQDDIETAQKTTGQDIVPVKVSQPSMLPSAFILPAAQVMATARNNNDIVANVRQKGDLTRIFQDVIHTGTEMVDAFEGAIRHNFKYDLTVKETAALGVLGLLTAGYFPVKMLLQGHDEIIPVKGFQMAKAKFAKAVRVIPYEDQRHALDEFMKAVEIGFLMEHALTLLKPDKKSTREINKALSMIDTACKLAGHNEADMLRIKQAATDGTMESRSFYGKIAQQWDPFLMDLTLRFYDRANVNWAKIYEAADFIVRRGYGTTVLEEQLKSMRNGISWSFKEGDSDDESYSAFCHAISARTGMIDFNKPSLVATLHTQIAKPDQKVTPS